MLTTHNSKWAWSVSSFCVFSLVSCGACSAYPDYLDVNFPLKNPLNLLVHFGFSASVLSVAYFYSSLD